MFISIKIITNKRTYKSDHSHFAIVSPSFFFKVLHPVFISIKIITNKRTYKSDRLHFAIVSPSFFFKVLHPVFISIKIITNKRTDKSDYSHFAIVSPSFSFSKYFIQCSYIISIKELLTNEVTKVINHTLPLLSPLSMYFIVQQPCDDKLELSIKNINKHQQNY